MDRDRFAEDLSDRLSSRLPPGLDALREDLRRNFRAIIQSSLDRLDLVSREEFEVQRAVLERARARLGELEQRIAELEGGRKGKRGQG